MKQETLIQYAKEDIAILKDEGNMAITDTKIGVIWLSYENGKFGACNQFGEELIGNMNEENLATWIASKYKVS